MKVTLQTWECNEEIYEANAIIETDKKYIIKPKGGTTPIHYEKNRGGKYKSLNVDNRVVSGKNGWE